MSTEARDVGPREAGYFVDVVTDEPFSEGETWDADGRLIVGDDECGVWWGTERAAWVLDPRRALVRVDGWLGPYPWTGWFVATEAASRDYAERHGVRIDEVEVYSAADV